MDLILFLFIFENELLFYYFYRHDILNFFLR
jgi:hypothetical protein